MSSITSTASVATARAPRYGKQLVSHLGRRSVGVWDESTATGTLDMSDSGAGMDGSGAHVTFTTKPDALLIEITSADADVATFEDVVGRHLVRFGERDELRVQWVRSNSDEGSTQG